MALGNGSGVSIIAAGNTVGGSTATPGTPPGNVISGNGAGVSFGGSNASGNVVRGNIIGASADGLSALPNNGGVGLGQRAGGNTVGGAAPGDRNLISGNVSTGISCSLCNSNPILGNWIGVNIVGAAPLPNGIGILLSSGASPGATLAIGGSNPGEGNVISGNVTSGVRLSSPNSFVTGGSLLGNLIGVAPDGVTAMGNGTYGVEFAANSSMVIGGTAGITPGACTGSCNAIRFNGSDGLAINGPFASPIQIRSNSFSDNGGLGIDNPADGVTPNDVPDTYPQNFPVITFVSYDSGTDTSTIQGTLTSAASTSFAIEVFSNTASDPSGFGEGETYRGTTTCFTDTAGNGSWSVIVPGGASRLTTTATGATSGTSEFSGTFVDSDGDGYADGADNCPSVPNPGQIDTDFDGHGDDCDCAPTNSGAFQLPLEIGGVMIASNKQTITWNSAAPAAGTATVHDVLRGLDSDLPVNGGGSEMCLASIAGTMWTDAAVPSAGQDLWYLVRGRNVCGAGTYGYASSGTERSSMTCP